MENSRYVLTKIPQKFQPKFFAPFGLCDESVEKHKIDEQTEPIGPTVMLVFWRFLVRTSVRTVAAPSDLFRDFPDNCREG
jgi:hypothetical protein